MIIICIFYQPFDPFRAKVRIVLRKERSGFELQDLFENLSCVVLTSISLLSCQLPVFNTIIMLVVERRGNKNKVNLPHEIQEVGILAEMIIQERVFKIDRVLDHIIEAIQSRLFPHTGIHLNQLYQSVKWYVWRELPGDRSEERDCISKATQQEKMLSVTLPSLVEHLPNQDMDQFRS